ncbi:MAG: HD domain-containing protein [Bacteroidales bacterium]|nr:HD domain-containing protein [Bacteroidales bacterium]
MKKIKDELSQIVVDYYSKYPSAHQDILHTMEVVFYARMISIGEGWPENKIEDIEMAALLHDIGCPLSKEIYGNSLPVNQQNVGREVANQLLKNISSLSDSQSKWLEDVVGTHHQFKHASELGFLPLFEADLIVNILSGYYKKERTEHFFDKLMTTKSGKKLFKTLIK